MVVQAGKKQKEGSSWHRHMWGHPSSWVPSLQGNPLMGPDTGTEKNVTDRQTDTVSREGCHQHRESYQGRVTASLEPQALPLLAPFCNRDRKEPGVPGEGIGH